MLEKVNYQGIIKSLYLGLGIGVIIQVFLSENKELSLIIISIIASGVIGLLIGAITEFVTAMLPITLARPNMYFFINNLIALFVVTLILLSTNFIAEVTADEFSRILLWVICIVLVANGIDYVMYRYTNRKLINFKKRNK